MWNMATSPTSKHEEFADSPPNPPIGEMVRLSRAVLEGWKAKSCRSKPKKYSKEDLLAAPILHNVQ